MISKFRIRIADIIRIALHLLSYILVYSLHPTIAAQQQLVLLYSGRNAHILSEVDLSRLPSRSCVLKSVNRLTTI